MNIKVIISLLKETFAEWNKDKVARIAAALAYYTMFSLAPLLIIVIAIAGSIFGEEAARNEIVTQIEGLVGRDGAEFIQTAIENASQPAEGTFASAISFVVLLFGATGLFAELQDALNTVWEVQPKPNQGLLVVIRNRFLSFAMILGIGFLLLVSLVLGAALAAIVNLFGSWFPFLSSFLQLLSFVFGFVVTTFLFAAIYKILPDVKIAWSDVWIGAIITSFLFSVGRFLLGQYIGNSSLGSIYGAAGSLVVVLVWVFYASQILLLGAEFTQVYARRFGSGIVPAKNAVPLTPEARAEQGLKSSDEQSETSTRPRRQRSNFLSRIFSGSKRRSPHRRDRR
ncbi:YihY/virulence factor BrkB family protein [Gloeocapsa sp. BRSZ]